MNRKLWMTMLIILLLGFAGCQENPQPTVWEGDMIVYYLGEEEISIVYEWYTPKREKGAELAKELLARMLVPSEEEHIAAIPKTVALPDVSIGSNGLVTLQFDESYGTVSGVREVLMRAAIVKTLCQMSDVDSVEIYVAGQPLMGAENMPIGIMKSDDFIDNTGPETNYYQYLYATVYFANREGNALVASNLKIPYSGSETDEQVVMRQLIEGPVEEDMYPVLSNQIKVLGVSTKDGICTVNLSRNFLNRLSDVSEEVTIYSVVNTLAELPGVYRVQFLIDGEQVKNYETMELSLPYERNLNVVEKE